MTILSVAVQNYNGAEKMKVSPVSLRSNQQLLTECSVPLETQFAGFSALEAVALCKVLQAGLSRESG